MIRSLKNLTAPIRVGLVGAGLMGRGIAHQIARTPGMKLSWIASRRPEKAKELAIETGAEKSGGDACRMILNHPIDVVVEASNQIWAAYHHAHTALENGAHVVLMNAEVDLVFGPLLNRLAAAKGLVCTSDAGDQHGVLARMIDEVSLWGFEVIQAGNVKGFLKQHAQGSELVKEASKRNLELRKCCAFTDGTKLNIEMALIANGFGYLPSRVGMTGPTVSRVEDAMNVFQLDQMNNSNSQVDYVLGAQPGGAVYVIAHCENPVHNPYLKYYKLGNGPFYLFKEDQHLCHLETPTSIARAFFYNESILKPWAGRITEVYAFAKNDMEAGSKIDGGIGGDHFYGQIASTREGQANNWVPIALLDDTNEPTRIEIPMHQNEPLTWTHVPSYSNAMIDLYRHPDNHAPVD